MALGVLKFIADRTPATRMTVPIFQTASLTTTELKRVTMRAVLMALKIATPTHLQPKINWAVSPACLRARLPKTSARPLRLPAAIFRARWPFRFNIVTTPPPRISAPAALPIRVPPEEQAHGA